MVLHGDGSGGGEGIVGGAGSGSADGPSMLALQTIKGTYLNIHRFFLLSDLYICAI